MFLAACEFEFLQNVYILLYTFYRHEGYAVGRCLRNYVFKKSVAQNIQSNAGTLSLRISRSGTKLEKTSLTTGGFTVPAYGFVYFVQLRIENMRFCNCQNFSCW